MKYLEGYNMFSFFKKKEKKEKDWKSKFEDIYDYYLKNKDKKSKDPMDILYKPDVSIKSDNFYVAMRHKKSLEKTHVLFSTNRKGKEGYEVVDFGIHDYSKPDSTEGVYKITKDEYDSYLKKAKEIDNWLDDSSEKEYNKSNREVGKDGNIDLDFDEGDMALDEISDKLKEELDIFNKEYEFEMNYVHWESSSSNERKTKEHNLVFTDLEVGFNGSFYFELSTKDLQNRDSRVWIYSDTNYNYFDFESEKLPYNKAITLTEYIPNLARKKMRERIENIKYPHTMLYRITPSKYNSIEMVKMLVELLQEMDSQIKNKK